MCIRDSVVAKHNLMKQPFVVVNKSGGAGAEGFLDVKNAKGCLLYTSDAADERSSVDLGGRRIIKKKKNKNEEDRRKLTKKV